VKEVNTMEQFVISILVSNRSGVLTRVSSMFTRRGFNIDTLTVGETESPEFSRITITLHGNKTVCDQLVKQLEKMYDVQKVQVMLRDETVARELLLIKVQHNPQQRHEILSVTDVFRAKIIDFSQEALVIEIQGASTKINAFIEMIKPYGILEMCRTGLVSLERGGNCLKNQ
jgi:acetolactate synthase-1/3 small subunit